MPAAQLKKKNNIHLKSLITLSSTLESPKHTTSFIKATQR